jgi:hypothetical protein
MRDLTKIIEEILEVAPKLRPSFLSLLDSILYTPPETMITRWNQTAELLQTVAKQPNITEEAETAILKIFNDT